MPSKLTKPSKRRQTGQINSSRERHESALLPWVRGLLPTLNTAQRRIANALLDDPERFLTEPVSGLAARCGVSPGSIVLFCRFLGLSGLPMLRISLARELASQVLPPFTKAARQREHGSVFQKVFQEHVQSLDETLRMNSPAALQVAAKAIDKARRIVLFGIGQSFTVAYSLYSRIRFLGFPALLEYDSHMQLAAAAEMMAGEVAIAFSVSGATKETVECLSLARARGAKTICFTNSVNSPLARIADIRFYAAPFGMKYFQASIVPRGAQLALADALVWTLGMRRKRKALIHLQRAEEQLLTRRLVRNQHGSRG